MKRYVRFHKGRLAEDLRGAHVTWSIRDRTYLATVTAVTYDNGIFRLSTRYFNGEQGPTVAAGAVQVLSQEDDR
jgi:hypothetical protein